MPDDERARDLERATAVIEDLTGVRPRAMSYPYGTVAAVSAAAGRSAAAAGYVAGFSTERAFNRTLEDPLLLARIDTNDAPGGKSPRFEIDDDGGLVLSERITPARTRYFAEST
jgi:peptidoglycan/xylan/chitin deacetylase (PgdA/CDA1 family)